MGGEGEGLKRVCLVLFCLPISVSVCLSVFLPVCLPACLSVCLSVCLPVYLSPCLPVSLSLCVSIWLYASLIVYSFSLSWLTAFFSNVMVDLGWYKCQKQNQILGAICGSALCKMATMTKKIRLLMFFPFLLGMN